MKLNDLNTSILFDNVYDWLSKQPKTTEPSNCTLVKNGLQVEIALVYYIYQPNILCCTFYPSAYLLKRFGFVEKHEVYFSYFNQEKSTSDIFVLD